MKLVLTVIFGLIPINVLKITLLNLLGHKIDYTSKIGYSILLTSNINLGKHTRIGHFNFIKIKTVTLEEKAFIKHLNYIKGPFLLVIKKKGSMSNQNKIRRAYPPVTYAVSTLEIGINTQIASNQFLDLTKSIIIGENSQIAGVGAQLWTHGYYHATDKDHNRIRIDGEIHIGNNVYIGSRCIFNPGVSVSNAIHIGSGSVISKNLEKPGMYVNQGLRFIENDFEKVKEKLKKNKRGCCRISLYKRIKWEY
jgi:acetyltransferase-like isoleucine patch superfamily enzyme